MFKKEMDGLKQITAAIIAGGKSRRFGEPKALARFEDRTLLERALEVARQLSPRIMVVAPPDLYALPEDVPVYQDLIPACGPLSGVHAALYYSRDPVIATLPCDMPLLSADLYRVLVAEMRPGRPAVARSHKGLEPLVALWPKSALPAVEAQLRAEKYQMRMAFAALNALEVPLDEKVRPYLPEWFANVNTRQDLRELKSGAK